MLYHFAFEALWTSPFPTKPHVAQKGHALCGHHPYVAVTPHQDFPEFHTVADILVG